MKPVIMGRSALAALLLLATPALAHGKKSVVSVHDTGYASSWAKHRYVCNLSDDSVTPPFTTRVYSNSYHFGDGYTNEFLKAGAGTMADPLDVKLCREYQQTQTAICLCVCITVIVVTTLIVVGLVVLVLCSLKPQRRSGEEDGVAAASSCTDGRSGGTGYTMVVAGGRAYTPVYANTAGVQVQQPLQSGFYGSNGCGSHAPVVPVQTVSGPDTVWTGTTAGQAAGQAGEIGQTANALV